MSDMYDRIAEQEIKMEQEEAVFGNSLVVKSGWMTKQVCMQVIHSNADLALGMMCG